MVDNLLAKLVSPLKGYLFQNIERLRQKKLQPPRKDHLKGG